MCVFLYVYACLCEFSVYTLSIDLSSGVMPYIYSFWDFKIEREKKKEIER